MAVRCLLVDDNDYFLAAARNLLERDGITVVGTASTSADALHMVGGLRPDVTLVDIDLGPESGFDLARQLHVMHAQEVILISGYSEGDLSDLIAGSTALAFLPKSRISGQAIREALTRSGPRNVSPGRGR